eukprot:Skav212345  [mRNA]  locus=scaffold1488:274051:279286:+ [translate_table: standard]
MSPLVSWQALARTAVNIIQGLALGYKSCIIPVFVLSSAIFVSFQLCDLYGIALAALGMLATLACGLTIDGFGPISDNAGGIAEMALFNPEVRRRTDALDAAGNTTAAIGKGFAIGSAALVSLALYGAFVVRLRASCLGENDTTRAAFLIIGCMIPYWFAALTMKSVGKAAGEMVAEVKRQFSIKDPRKEHDSKGKTLLDGSCSAEGSLRIAHWISGLLRSVGHFYVQLRRCLGQLQEVHQAARNGFSDDIELRYTKNPKTQERDSLMDSRPHADIAHMR